MADRKPANKSTRKAAKSTTVTSKNLLKGFTAEELAAIWERVQELKAGPRRRPGTGYLDSFKMELALGSL
jgi:hypothetical protein